MPELELQGSTSSTALGWEQLCTNTPTLQSHSHSAPHASPKIPNDITEMLGTLSFSLSLVFILEKRVSWHKMGVSALPTMTYPSKQCPLGSAWGEWLGTAQVAAAASRLSLSLHYRTGMTQNFWTCHPKHPLLPSFMGLTKISHFILCY